MIVRLTLFEYESIVNNKNIKTVEEVESHTAVDDTDISYKVVDIYVDNIANVEKYDNISKRFMKPSTTKNECNIVTVLNYSTFGLPFSE